ncbi:MAG: cytochrome P450 [Pseudonocardiaceae bacterium]
MKSVSMLPQAPGGMVVLGHALPMLRDPLEFLRILPTYGDLVEIRVGPFKAVVICDPDLTQQVFVNDRVFDKGGPFYDRVREVIGNALGTCAHDGHRRQRRLAQPAFHRDRFPEYSQLMAREIITVTRAWRDGQAIDVLSETMMISTRISVALMFGDTPLPASLGEIIDHVTTMAKDVYMMMFLKRPLNRLPIPSARRFERACKSLRTILGRLLHDRRSDETGHHDLLSILLAGGYTCGGAPATTGKEEQALSDVEAIDQLITFFIGSMETTGITLAWALDLTARHPDIQKSLQVEIDSFRGCPIRFDDLPALALTQQVITETLRLYPPVWFMTRKTTADSRLGEHPIPAGTTLVYSPYLIHHRSDLHPDPNRFDPDRWTTGHTTPRHAFIPFGGGARKCIGDVFALTEAALALAVITADWNLEPTTSQPPRPILGATLRPQRFTLRVTSRHSGEIRKFI